MKGEPLAQPYTVKQVGGQRTAVIGVTEVPAGLDILPHLKEQLAGIRIQPPVEALTRWLPKAKEESDRVVLIYYGSAAGLRPIRERFAADLALILVGGTRPDSLPGDAKPPLVGTSNHGRHLALVSIDTMGAKLKAEVTQLAVEPRAQARSDDGDAAGQILRRLGGREGSLIIGRGNCSGTRRGSWSSLREPSRWTARHRPRCWGCGHRQILGHSALDGWEIPVVVINWVSRGLISQAIE